MEIEKKFLIKEMPKNLSLFKTFEIEQGYINSSPVIRIRKSNTKFFLTVKNKGKIAREEFEIEISEKEYNILKQKVEGNEIKKTRFLIPLHDNFVGELDIFHEFLEGLKTIEVEFNTLEEANNFLPPIWFGEDVSTKKKYKNNNLSKLTVNDFDKINELINL